MSAPPPVALQRGLVTRAKAILLQPRTEWHVIDTEPSTIGSIYTGYVLPLAAIPAICGAVWLFRFTPGLALRYAITTYVLALVSVYVLALIIDALAPSFGAQKNLLQAFKVAAYSYTASWVAGVFLLLPALGILALIGSLYSLYLFFVGLPILMKVAADRATSYAIVCIIAAIVVAVVIGYIAGAVGGLGGVYGAGFYR